MPTLRVLRTRRYLIPDGELGCTVTKLPSLMFRRRKLRCVGLSQPGQSSSRIRPAGTLAPGAGSPTRSRHAGADRERRALRPA